MGYTRVIVLLVCYINIMCIMLQLASSSRPEPSRSKSEDGRGEKEEKGGGLRNTCLQIMYETEGPYWVEENIEAANVKSNLAYGVPLNLTFRVVDGHRSLRNNRCEPISSARIDLWQCRYDGRYSDESKEQTQGETWLRGYQFTNSTGYASFYTIYPGWYVSRTVHIHVRIRLYNVNNSSLVEETTTQLFFDDSISNAIFKNVYPYNARGSTRDTFNSNDPLFVNSNIIALVGNYSNQGGYNALVEFTLPLSSPMEEVEEHYLLTT